MKTSKTDPLIESLMGLAVAAAPFIRRARDSGIFRPDVGASRGARATDETVVEATGVKTPDDAQKPAPEASGEMAALQGILVRQAMRIAELEAEVAALKAAAVQTKAAGDKPSKPASAKATAKKPVARKKPAK